MNYNKMFLMLSFFLDQHVLVNMLPLTYIFFVGLGFLCMELDIWTG